MNDLLFGYNEYAWIKAVPPKGTPMMAYAGQSVSHVTHPMPDDFVAEIGTANQIPKNPHLPDYFGLPDAVISKKIYEVLAPLQIKNVQLIPTKTYVGDEIYEDFWLIHMYNFLKCLDYSATVADISPVTIGSGSIMLSKKKLAEIPLEERLVFRLYEGPSIKVFHKSIVEKIMSVNPTGLEFRSLLGYMNW